jgi:fucose permease
MSGPRLSPQTEWTNPTRTEFDHGVRWDRLTVAIGLIYATLSWSLGYGVLMPELRDEVTMSDSVASLHGSAFGFALLGAALLGPQLLRRFTRHRLLAWAALAMAGGAVVFGIGRAIALTLLGAAVTGLGAALMVLIAPGLVVDLHPDDPHGATSTLNATPMLAGLTLPFAIAAGGGALGWRWVYIVPVMVIGVVGAALASGHPAPPTVVGDGHGPVRSLRLPSILACWLVLVVGVMIELGIGFWAVEALEAVAGASSGTAAIALALYFGAMMTCRLVAGRLIATFGTARVLLASGIGHVLAVSVFVAGPGVVVRIVALIAAGLAVAPMYPVSVTRLMALGPTDVMAPVATLGSAAGVISGPLILGLASDAVGLRGALVALPVFGALFLVVLRRADRMTRGSAEPHSPNASDLTSVV